MAAYLETAAHSAYDMFSKYKYLIVNLLFLTSVFAFWNENFFLIAPFPDHCLLVPFYVCVHVYHQIPCELYGSAEPTKRFNMRRIRYDFSSPLLKRITLYFWFLTQIKDFRELC